MVSKALTEEEWIRRSQPSKELGGSEVQRQTGAQTRDKHECLEEQKGGRCGSGR